MKRNNILIYLGTAFLALGQSFSRGNFPSYVEVLGGTIVNYGFIQSIQTFSNLLFLFPAAFLADKVGHRRLILGGSVIYAISYFIIAFTPPPHWEYLLLGGFGVGLGQGMIMPSQVAILAHNNPTDRINVFTRNETMRWGNLALGYFLSSFFFILNQDEFSYRNLQQTMFVTFLVAICAIIPSLLLVNAEEWRNNIESQLKVEIKEMIKRPEGTYIIGFLAISIMIGFGAGFLVPFAQPYFVKRFLLGPSEVNIIMGTAQVLTAVFMGFIPLLSSILGSNAKVIYLTQGISIPLILIIAYSTFLPLSIIAFLFRIVLMNMSSPAQTTIVQDYVPEAFRARIQSLMRVSDRLGRSFSPSISAMIIDETKDFYLSFTITAIMYTTAVSTLFIMTRNLKRKLRKNQI
ncbi:MAG: MFS transporter [Candidatus Heimdallarchaeota archaeon]|nr:MAG: MFS transporter [Candidatus Heimdallarchaeota archaeon]